jgi:hypothetical protein
MIVARVVEADGVEGVRVGSSKTRDDCSPAGRLKYGIRSVDYGENRCPPHTASRIPPPPERRAAGRAGPIAVHADREDRFEIVRYVVVALGGRPHPAPADA